MPLLIVIACWALLFAFPSARCILAGLVLAKLLDDVWETLP